MSTITRETTDFYYNRAQEATTEWQAAAADPTVPLACVLRVAATLLDPSDFEALSDEDVIDRDALADTVADALDVLRHDAGDTDTHRLIDRAYWLIDSMR